MRSEKPYCFLLRAFRFLGYLNSGKQLCVLSHDLALASFVAFPAGCHKNSAWRIQTPKRGATHRAGVLSSEIPLALFVDQGSRATRSLRADLRAQAPSQLRSGTRPADISSRRSLRAAPYLKVLRSRKRPHSQGGGTPCPGKPSSNAYLGTIVVGLAANRPEYSKPLCHNRPNHFHSISKPLRNNMPKEITAVTKSQIQLNPVGPLIKR